MHERTRRRLCRALFLTLCLLPTAVTCATIAYRQSPWYAHAHRAAWQQAIARQSGLEAQIGRVRFPRRGVTILEDVRLADPDGGGVLLRARLVECAVTHRGLVVAASQPEIDAGRLSRLRELWHERVLRGPGPDAPLQLAAAELTLAGGDRPQTLTDVRCTLERRETGIELLLDFQVAGIEMPAPAQLRVERNRQLDPPATAWQLRTGTAPLPCSLAAALMPSLDRLGPRCRFAGDVRVRHTPRGAEGDVVGLLEGVDLTRLVEPFPHKLSGAADVTLQRLRFRAGRVERAEGRLEARGGDISRSLVLGLAAALEAPTPLAADIDGDPLLRFENLACGFRLDGAALAVTGRCAEPGAILVSAEGPLLSQPAGDVPAVALTRALAPASEFQLAATRETDLLIRVLPLPDAAPPETARRRYSPVRLRE